MESSKENKHFYVMFRWLSFTMIIRPSAALKFDESSPVLRILGGIEIYLGFWQRIVVDELVVSVSDPSLTQQGNWMLMF